MLSFAMIAASTCLIGAPQAKIVVVEAAPRPRISAAISVPGTSDRAAVRTVTTTVETRRVVKGKLMAVTTTTVTTDASDTVRTEPIISASH